MMPRRSNEAFETALPVKKKLKVLEDDTPSLDVSFCDDEALPPGIVFTDIKQRCWRIGRPIGRGSFGRIYLASDDTEKEVTKQNACYVVKIEPHTNGPLFVEVHCLIRTAVVSKVKEWRHNNKQKRLGMPLFIASGSFTDENTGTKYRFLVLPRYDIDLQKIIARTKVLDLRNVLVLALQILDVLEYLHHHGYTHSDIKSSNLMLGFGSKLNKQAMPKPTPSFQKETKEVAVLSGKPRRPKSSKGRSSNYYDDEDFVVKHKVLNPLDLDSERKLADVKRKLRKFLSDKDHRNLHRHHAFNLRQLSNYVNYEDMSSSVCSDQSYQKLLDESRNNLLNLDQFYEDKFKGEVLEDLEEIHKEAVLSQSNGQIYLLDYGLASKFLDPQGKHKDFGMDARKAHDGTLEYSSRDSHIGAHSRRSDLETLGFNLLDWLTGTLPWKTTEVLSEPDLVHALKKKYMTDVKLLLKTCFKTDFYPQFIEKYLEYVTSLDFVEKPDYEYCRSLFKSELLKNGYDKDVPLSFAEPPMPPKNRKICYSKKFGRKNISTDFLARTGIKNAFERENVCSLENDLKLELLKQTLNSSSDGIRKPCTSRNFFISDADLVARLKKSLMPHDILGKKLSPKNLRSKVKNIKKRQGVRRHRNSIGKFGNFMGSARQFTWAEILAQNPEHIIRKERNTVANTTEDDESTCKYRIRTLSDTLSDTNSETNLSPLMQKDYLQYLNPTYAMKEVVAQLKKKAARKVVKENDEHTPKLEGYTPAMIKVYKMKEKRLAKENTDALKLQKSLQKETKIIDPPTQRCTRSSKNRTKRSSPIENKTINTRSSGRKTENVTQEQKQVVVVIEKMRDIKRKVKEIKNVVTSKNKVKNVGSPKESVAKTKKPASRARQVTVPIYRRRLRSSKRNRN